MSKGLALLFSVAGVLLLACIGAALSYRNGWLAAGAALACVLLIGAGFGAKARARRRAAVEWSDKKGSENRSKNYPY